VLRMVNGLRRLLMTAPFTALFAGAVIAFWLVSFLPPDGTMSLMMRPFAFVAYLAWMPAVLVANQLGVSSVTVVALGLGVACDLILFFPLRALRRADHHA
jgi:hypothetical protein